jgi:1-acyl-sn-glycerol-3-phosphate acyltransferase
MSEQLPLILLLSVLLLLFWQLYRLFNACRKANRVDWGSGWVNLLDGLNRLFCYRYHRLNVLGLRIPKQGPFILAANHISGLDPLLIVASARRPIRFLIAREQYERFGLKWLFRAAKCIPVDREGRPDRALRAAIKSLQEGHVVALFPHGKIHTEADPPIPLKPGVALLSKLAKVDILPMRISGVRGVGHVVRGVFLRSTAQIDSFPTIEIKDRERKELLQELQEVLDGQVAEKSADT